MLILERVQDVVEVDGVLRELHDDCGGQQRASSAMAAETDNKQWSAGEGAAAPHLDLQGSGLRGYLSRLSNSRVHEEDVCELCAIEASAEPDVQDEPEGDVQETQHSHLITFQ